MSDLGLSAKALIEAARPALGPDVAAIARMRAAVDVAAGATAAAASTTIGASGAKAVATTSALGVGKIIVLSLVAIATTGALIVGGMKLRSSPRGVSLATSAPTEVAANVVAVAPIASAPAVALNKPAASSNEPPAPAPAPAPAPIVVAQRGAPAIANHRAATNEHAAASVAPEPQASASPVVVAPPEAASLPLAREVELLDNATVALRNGSTTLALGMIDKYEHATSGHGQLAEDAAAIKVEALCTTHDTTTVTAIELRFPHIAQRTRVRAACGSGQ